MEAVDGAVVAASSAKGRLDKLVPAARHPGAISVRENWERRERAAAQLDRSSRPREVTPSRHGSSNCGCFSWWWSGGLKLRAALEEDNAHLRQNADRLRALAQLCGASDNDIRAAEGLGLSWAEAVAPSTHLDVSHVSSLEAVPTLPCVLVTDIGGDLGDDLAAVLLRHVMEMGKIQLQTAIVNGPSPHERARLMRGTLDTLGLHSVPVGVGTDGGRDCSGGSDFRGDWSDTYVPTKQSQVAKSLLSGRRLLHLTFLRAPEKSLVLLVLSSPKDVALFLRDNADLFCAKIRCVVATVDLAPHREHYLCPDLEFKYNAADQPSARFLYRRLQELRVPLVCVDSTAAKAAPAPRAALDALAELGSPIGWRVRSLERRRLRRLWREACVEDGRSTDVASRRREFREAFGDGRRPEQHEEDIWESVCHLEYVELVAVVAAVPELRRRYVPRPERREVDGVEHLVITADSVSPELGASLREWLPAGIAMGTVRRPEIIIITDPGQDLDDEMTLILLRALVEDGLVDCEAVICNLKPARRRALLARGTLDELGLHHVKVGVGSDGGSEKHRDTFSSSITSQYVPKDMEFVDGQVLLRSLYAVAPEGGLQLLLISALTDVAVFVRDNEALFVAKTRSVTVMGGVEAFDPRDDAPLVPDTAANNIYDFEAAKFTYRRIQELGVPLVVLSRYAAYKCPMLRTIYDDLAWTGMKVGQRLQEAQRNSMEDLWRRAVLPPDDQRRLGLPSRCDKAWFCETFCQGRGLDRDRSDTIWDLVVSFNMCAVCPLLL